MDADNAMETNKDMMMPAQSDTVLKQAAANGAKALLHIMLEKGLITKEAADEAMVDPSWSAAQRAMGQARQWTPGGVGQFVAHPELQTKEVTHGLAGTGIVHGEQDYLKGKGIHPKLLGLGGAKLTPEAAKQYLGARDTEYAEKASSVLADLRKTAGAEHQDVIARAQQAVTMMVKAASSNTPAKLARSMIVKTMGEDAVKLAEDALFPAKIDAGTEPELQSDPGSPSVLMQGSEAGVNTPRETAPTSGEGGGRNLLASNEAAINATKRDAKTQNKGALAEVLNEPAMSASSDKTLGQSLDNTSSAGVKISSARANAARELLRKFQEASPENAQKLAHLVKAADEQVAPGGGMPPGPGEMTGVPDEIAPAEEPAVPPEAMEETAAPVSDEALEAARAGVTPEELAQAEALLAQQGLEGGGTEEGAMEPEVAGEAGKESNMPMGGGAPGGGMPPSMPGGAM
jgi:hypothetical protein